MVNASRLPGVRYYDRLIGELAIDKEERSRIALALLVSQETRRILFDARQAALFDALAEMPPATIQIKIRAPFDIFYLEFSEPIHTEYNEPGHDDDLLRAFLLRSPIDKITVHDAGRSIQLPLWSVIAFLSSPYGNAVRGCGIVLETGQAITKMESALTTAEPSSFPPGSVSQWIVAEGSIGPKGKVVDRHVGWWERCISRYAALVSWCCAYMMAKGITVREEPLSRQQRRWHEAHRQLPRPWHIVEVEPRFQASPTSRDEPAYHHGYRYDVIGHLRFNHHRIKDEWGEWAHKETIEWVMPHQRGLANELYIPSTWRVDAGKHLAPEMGDYWGKER